MDQLVDVARAQISRGRDGSVTFDDPEAPWVIRLWTDVDGGVRHVTRLRIDVRPGCPGVTATRLARLPMAQMLYVATAETVGDAHPNETYFRMLAKPKPEGGCSWDDGHWERVLQVHDWAVETNRPGGGRRAVADLWGVSLNPTVIRWLREARRRAKQRGDA